MSATTTERPRSAPPTRPDAPAAEAPAATDRPKLRIPWTGYAWTTGIVGAAAFFLGTAYPGLWVGFVLLGLTVVTAALQLVGETLRLPRLVVPIALLTLVLVGSVIALTNAPRIGPDGATDPPVWRLLLDSVPRLLSTPPQATARLDLVAPVAIITVIAAMVAIVRVQVRGRGPLGIAHVLSAGVLYAAALLLTAGAADRYGLVAAGLIMLSLLSWVKVKTATVGAVLACAACATAVAAASFPAGKDIRAIVTPPKITVFQANLLPYLKLWSDQTDIQLFGVSGNIPDRIALAVYTQYDGSSWSSGQDFALFGSTVAAPLPKPKLQDAYDMKVTMTALPTEWVPSAGTVTSVSQPDFVQDLTGGGLLWIGHAADSASYTVQGTIDVTTDQTVEQAAVPDASVAGAYLDQPPLPPALSAWVQTNLAPYTTRFEQAAALEAILREDRQYDPKSTGGSSMASIIDLVLRPASEGGQRGTQEQFASAYAALARSIGLPTRLVIGSRTSTVVGVADDSADIVTSGDISVWPEVYFADAGWVPFNPVPKGDPTPQQEKNSQVRDGSNDEEESGNVDVPVANNRPKEQEAPQAPVDWAAIGTRAGIGVGGLVAVALVASLAAGLVVQRRLRRRGAVGAWTSVERGGRLAGLDVRPSWSAQTVAAEVGRVAGVEEGGRATRIATAAEIATYSPDGAAAPPGPVWKDAVAVRRSLRAGLPVRRRLTWFVKRSGWKAL